jgi:hypothetical protein
MQGKFLLTRRQPSSGPEGDLTEQSCGDLLNLCHAEEIAMRGLAAQYAALCDTIYQEQASWRGLTLGVGRDAAA